ncbi:WXG100 family type VII secretion target [Nocardia transvalensis]|uniref:WXG100 family type VII secretion target n=1 Tax=Nocardia transvalensis TaxID=37333 RepID=UPI001894355A|nr:WXG100 family type VII secretion target [Nocardia transvalensis]MBF6332337.1 WXG100 family type VII secretion target [Nocardia transvalensis]
MLPTRTQLNGWNLGNLLAAAADVRKAGAQIEEAVVTLKNRCAELPELRGWEGKSHDAALTMFGRAGNQAAAFSDLADEVATALDSAYHSLTAVKNRIDTTVHSIENGPLWVTDMWVVLIRADQPYDADVLRKAQTAWQKVLNPLLIQLGSADDSAAQALAQINTDHGLGNFNPIIGRPLDAAPNPATPIGVMQQLQIQAEDAAVTVAGVTDEDKDGSHIKTITMQDGGKQVITTTASYQPTGERTPGEPFGPSRGDSVQTAATYDPSGKLIGTVRTIKQPDGTIYTDTSYPGKAYILGRQTPGKDAETILAVGPDGKELDPKKVSNFFTHPQLNTVGGAISGLDNWSSSDRAIAVLSEKEISAVKVGSKFAGPALGFATTIWDVSAASSAHDACVAGISGTFGVAGSWAGGAVGGMVGSAGGPVAVAGAGAGAVAGSWIFGDIGARVGEAICK